MNNSNKILIAIIIILIISILGIGIWIIVNNQNIFDTKSNQSIEENVERKENLVTDENKNEVKNKAENTIINEVKNEEKTEIKNETPKTSIQKSIIGTYSNKLETNDYIHDASLIVTNHTDSSINFEISAIHGSNINNVNTGEVSGKATKIDIPEDAVIPNSTQYAYQFIDNNNGETCKITFVYTNHKMFEYIQVIEEYPNNINPYAGARVYFEGEYEKKS